MLLIQFIVLTDSPVRQQFKVMMDSPVRWQFRVMMDFLDNFQFIVMDSCTTCRIMSPSYPNTPPQDKSSIPISAASCMLKCHSRDACSHAGLWSCLGCIWSCRFAPVCTRSSSVYSHDGLKVSLKSCQTPVQFKVMMDSSSRFSLKSQWTHYDADSV